jgi:hypothetical protein
VQENLVDNHITVIKALLRLLDLQISYFNEAINSEVLKF